MIVNGYVIHLYCCCAECAKPGTRNATIQVCEPKPRQAWAKVRSEGWRVDRAGGRCWAPGHIRKSTDKPR